MAAINLQNIGIFEHKFSQTDLKPVWEEILEIQHNPDSAVPFNKGLAGNIKKEFLLQKSNQYLENLITPLILEYESVFQYLHNTQVNSQLTRIKHGESWVNFMRKNEINPLHTHRGVLSYVLWMNIPYDPKEEANLFPDANSSIVGGSFEIIYTNILGKIVNYRKILGPENAGEFILFPAGLAHMVYPFQTSETGERISIAGNFVFDIG